MTLRVLWATDRIGYGSHLHGPGRRLLSIAPHMDPAVVRLFACVMRAEDVELSRLFEAKGISLRHLGRHRLDPRTIAPLVRIIREEEIDVLHLTGYGASNFGRIAAALTGIPAIVHVTDHYYPWYQHVADRLLARWTTAVITVSNSVARDSPMFRSGRLAGRITVIQNAIDLEEFAPVDAAVSRRLRGTLGIRPEQLVVGYVGRLHEEKGLLHLLEAAPAILRAVPDACLLLVGDGPQRDELHERVRRLGLERNVIFEGFRTDVAAVLSMLDVVVLPSLTEGFPNVALEAMAVGRAIVASRVEGIEEIVAHERTGLLVSPANPRELAEAIVRLLEQPAERARLAGNAREASLGSGLDGYVKALVGVYRRVTDRGRTA
jgi:glycosyltransferase involved in cell wall biosynthesis